MAQVWFKLGDMGFFSNRVFPTPGLGAPGGWLYKYPVHEVGGPPCILSLLIAVALACIQAVLLSLQDSLASGLIYSLVLDIQQARWSNHRQQAACSVVN